MFENVTVDLVWFGNFSRTAMPPLPPPPLPPTSPVDTPLYCVGITLNDEPLTDTICLKSANQLNALVKSKRFLGN